MKIQLLDEATRDIAEGYHLYENQAEGLGEYFLDSIWSDINSLRLYAGIHPVNLGYHRMLSRRFPFAIYYRIEERSALIRAVLDCRRDPVRKIERLTQNA